MCKEHKLKKIAEGYCPVCGSSCINYGSMDIEDNVVSYPAQCNDCGATWNEDYELVFCGVSDVYDKDGNQLGSVIDLKGEEECPID